jgi:transposase-like protein
MLRQEHEPSRGKASAGKTVRAYPVDFGRFLWQNRRIVAFKPASDATRALRRRSAVEPPLSLLEFSRRFTSEEACQDYIFAVRYPEGFACPTCAVRRGWSLAGKRLIECPSGHKISLTAGTVMHGSKQELVTWFHAAYFVSTLTPGMSALQFQRQMGISRYETAFNMLHKLRAALVAPDRDPLHGEVEVDEAYVGGKEEGHPGRGTNDKALVACAVELLRWTDPRARKRRVRTGRVRLEVLHDASAEYLVPFVKASVERGAIVHTDGWPSYASLDAEGFKHRPEVQGTGKDARCKPYVHRIFSNLKNWLLGTHHGRVSRKHLQAYLNEYAFRFNRRFWRGPAFHRALSLAAHATDHPTYQSLYCAGNETGWVHPRRTISASNDPIGGDPE